MHKPIQYISTEPVRQRVKNFIESLYKDSNLKIVEIYEIDKYYEVYLYDKYNNSMTIPKGVSRNIKHRNDLGYYCDITNLSLIPSTPGKLILFSGVGTNNPIRKLNLDYN